MRKILFSMAALAVFDCSGLFPGVHDEMDYDGGYDDYGGGFSVDNGGGSYSDNNINNYRTVQIGGQRWMAENLNYYVAGSKCYDNKPSNCEKYGRLYDWATAMALPSSCNSNYCDSQIGAKHQGICPYGWHIPDDDDWEELFDFVGYPEGTHLKATDGWYNNGNGEDTYGFAALPGGFGSSDGYFSDVGYYGYWWSASEYNGILAYHRVMGYGIEYAYWYGINKTVLRSVRCVMD